MKTLFICDQKRLDDHDGEYYDQIIEVPTNPTTENIQEYASEVKDVIQNLWHDDISSEESCVSVYFDEPGPFKAMVIDLQIILKDTEDINIDMPQLETTKPTTNDPEALKILNKIEYK